MRTAQSMLILAGLLLSPFASAAQGQVFPVMPLTVAPVVDGDLSEWNGVEGNAVVVVNLNPAKQDDDKNVTGVLTVELKAGVAGDTFYLAVRWPDSTEDREHRPWRWRGNRYVRGNEREDMFTVRFDLEGDFDACMLTDREYRVDVWLWSAARTDPAGLAEDMHHFITTRMIEDAAEYKMPDDRTVYIKKSRDAGEPMYRVVPPPDSKAGESVPSVELTGNASGGIADVAAKGVWKDGYWHLELARKLNTGDPDDVVFKPGGRYLGNIAVFNRGYAEHKSVSTNIVFDFSAVK